MTFRIGVLPTASRNTPTPTSIFSGRGSASHSAISAKSESFTTGGRSARPFACVLVSMAARLAQSCVVIHCDSVAQGHRLAGQHIAVGNLLVGEAVARRHLDLAPCDLGPAGRADSGLAGEGRRQTRSARAVEDIALSERHPTRAPV